MKILPDLARELLDQVASSQDPYKILSQKVLKKIKTHFLDFLGEATQHGDREVYDLFCLLVMALIRKHALNYLQRTGPFMSRWWPSENQEDKADRISDDLYFSILQQLPRLLSSCRERGLDNEHVFNTFSKYCRVAVDHAATRYKKKEKGAPTLVSLTYGSSSEAEETEPCCPVAQQEFETSTMEIALERWLDSTDCPITHEAWRKFALRYQEGRPCKEIAKIFDTTANAISVNNSRVRAHLRRAGFLKEVLDLGLDRVLKAELHDRRKTA